MRFVRFEGLVGRRLDDQWRHSLELVVGNSLTHPISDVVVSARGDDWVSEVALGDLDEGSERPVQIVLPTDAELGGMLIVAQCTDPDGARLAIETRWQPE